jgi:hypothetical protein
MSSSNIPLARQILSSILLLFPDLPKDVKIALYDALDLMTREAPIRRAKSKHVVFDAVLKARVRKMAIDNPDVTIHDIATLTGSRNAGRVSEILNRKR